MIKVENFSRQQLRNYNDLNFYRNKRELEGAFKNDLRIVEKMCDSEGIDIENFNLDGEIVKGKMLILEGKRDGKTLVAISTKHKFDTEEKVVIIEFNDKSNNEGECWIMGKVNLGIKHSKQINLTESSLIAGTELMVQESCGYKNGDPRIHQRIFLDSSYDLLMTDERENFSSYHNLSRVMKNIMETIGSKTTKDFTIKMEPWKKYEGEEETFFKYLGLANDKCIKEGKHVKNFDLDGIKDTGARGEVDILVLEGKGDKKTLVIIEGGLRTALMECEEGSKTKGECWIMSNYIVLAVKHSMHGELTESSLTAGTELMSREGYLGDEMNNIKHHKVGTMFIGKETIKGFYRETEPSFLLDINRKNNKVEGGDNFRSHHKALGLLKEILNR